MRRGKAWLSAAAMALFLASCSPAPDIESLRAAIAQDYPSVDGSTSAHPLQVKLACDLLDVPWTWSAMSTDNVERRIIPDPTQSSPGPSTQTILDIVHNGTNGAYMNLIEGNADVILVARAPSTDELQAAEENGVTLDARAVALDAFVFLANVENPVESLTIDTIREIYTGHVTTWTELDIVVDPDSEGEELIHAYQRNRNSGSQELMEALVMRGTPMTDAPDMVTTSMLGPFNVIGGDPWTGNGDLLGLGYSVYYYTALMFPHSFVKMIGVEGVEPTSETIRTRAYPLVAEVYVAVREDTPQDSTAVKFRDWLFTEDGQRAIEESGYVPIH